MKHIIRICPTFIICHNVYNHEKSLWVVFCINWHDLPFALVVNCAASNEHNQFIYSNQKLLHSRSDRAMLIKVRIYYATWICFDVLPDFKPCYWFGSTKTRLLGRPERNSSFKNSLLKQSLCYQRFTEAGEQDSPLKTFSIPLNSLGWLINSCTYRKWWHY